MNLHSSLRMFATMEPGNDSIFKTIVPREVKRNIDDEMLYYTNDSTYRCFDGIGKQITQRIHSIVDFVQGGILS